MVASFLIRLITDRLPQGEFVGQIEHVASGRTATVRSPEELAAFARSTTQSEEHKDA